MPVSLIQSFDSFIEYLQFEKRYSSNTIISYRKDLSDFFDFINANFDDVELKYINHNFIRSWLASLKGKGLGAKSIKRKISSLKSFFKYQLKIESIEVSPMSKVISPKVGKRLPVFVKESETKNLIELLNSANEDWKTLNAKILISVFYATGMRLSELIGLKENQVDFGRSQIKVLGKGSKERVIPVSKGILHIIKEYQQLKTKEFEKTDDTLLVTEKGKKLYPKYAYLLVNKYLSESSTLEKKKSSYTSPHICYTFNE